MPTAPQPFTANVPDNVLTDLRDRLGQARFPDQLDGAGWDYGTELDYLKTLCAYWRDAFDWRAQEAALNAFDQFTLPIDGIDMHFIHQRSKHADATPIVITHGWPGSVFEFMKIIRPLTEPEAHGGEAGDAFHVVCPSIPGYGFSSAPTTPGFGVKQAAELQIKLMQALGYDRYIAQGGDWGAPISAWMASLDPDHCSGVHLNMPIAKRPQGVPREKLAEGLTETEVARLAESYVFQKTETGYFRIQATKPQTLGYPLNDSPVGLAAWIVEKFHTWSDCNGEVESRFTKDELLANITLYWVTGTITSSMRMYYETTKAGHAGPPDDYVETPTAVANFPKELGHPPRAWVENHFNVVQWTDMPRGGHFAAMEEPALLVEDVRAFASQLSRDLRPIT
jgi:microsomal epoxide hydrolase